MQHGVSRRRVLAGTAGLIAAPAIVHAQGQAGVALVIGNSKYRWEASLPNVKRDAPDIAKAFQALGLKTELVQDAGRDAMRAAVDKFATSARGASLAAFYFAGHGASWDKDTYLVPEDADLANPQTVQSLLPVTAVRDAIKEANHRLLVFDNCRNNPADGWRQRAAVIASRLTAADQTATSLSAPNTLMLFSTAPGRIALDGPAGENSPFASMFLRQLAGQAVDLQAMAAKLRRDLLVATEGRQVLWDQNTYTAPFVLKGGAARSGPARDPANVVDLPNAYAFARESRLILPAGLVSFRAPDGSPHAAKIGSFKSMSKVRVRDTTGNTPGTSLEPVLLVVIAVSDNDTAEVVVSTKDWSASGGLGWRYLSATLAGSRLKFDRIVPGSPTPFSPEDFAWRDADSGTYTSAGGNAAGSTMYYARFTRLDG